MSLASLIVREANFANFSQKKLANQLNAFEIVKNKFIENGVLAETQPEWRNVLAVRHFTLLSKDVSGGAYDDKIIATWSTDKGRSLAWKFFDANTDPSYQYSEEGRKLLGSKKRGEGLDADDDGKNDLGVLPFGAYKYHAFTSTASNKSLGEVFKPIIEDKRGIRVIVTSIEMVTLVRKMKTLLNMKTKCMKVEQCIFIEVVGKEQKQEILLGRQVVRL